MTEATIFQQLSDHADLLNTRDAGFSAAEISRGQVVMMMSPSGMHGLTATRIRQQLDPQVAAHTPDHVVGLDIE
ncbi:hypothetical protein ACFWDZ_33320, partial [Micromonospora aurantiaca]|uniref:hypothetical protein n=1 Tax=Micromonospora aurantiaca (nom. illeg.) TaxID=47850 RepID=UPI0036561D47